MAHYAGKVAYAEFIHSGGTVTITGDQRTLSWSQSQDFAETTAGNNDGKSWVKTTSEASGSFDFVENAEDAAYGTIIYEGQSGTLVWGHAGSETGKPKYSCAIFWESVEPTAAYDDTIMMTANWRKDGDWVLNYNRSGDTW